jgi:Protein of unknown function (DUF4058)
MPSPFPGMDPYLEKYWRDIHARLVTYICDQIGPQLPVGLYPQVEERIVMDSSVGIAARFPDVRVMEDASSPEESRPTSTMTATLSKPYIVHVPDEELSETFVEVRDVDGDQLVTVIEVLSPSNKRSGKDRRAYLRKRRDLVKAGVSLVEIDLLRSGRSVQTFSLDALPAEFRTIYHIYVCRGWDPESIEVHKLSLREQFSVVGMPMRESDADVPLNLQPLFERCYEIGRYGRLDYTADPDPPLSPDDAKWADELLRAKGLR